MEYEIRTAQDLGMTLLLPDGTAQPIPFVGMTSPMVQRMRSTIGRPLPDGNLPVRMESLDVYFDGEASSPELAAALQRSVDALRGLAFDLAYDPETGRMSGGGAKTQEPGVSDGREGRRQHARHGSERAEDAAKGGSQARRPDQRRLPPRRRHRFWWPPAGLPWEALVTKARERGASRLLELRRQWQFDALSRALREGDIEFLRLLADERATRFYHVAMSRLQEEACASGPLGECEALTQALHDHNRSVSVTALARADTRLAAARHPDGDPAGCAPLAMDTLRRGAGAMSGDEIVAALQLVARCTGEVEGPAAVARTAALGTDLLSGAPDLQRQVVAQLAAVATEMGDTTTAAAIRETPMGGAPWGDREFRWPGVAPE